MKIWVDIKNAHEPLFFKSLLSDLCQHEFLVTARDYVEVTKLLDKYDFNYIKVGKHHGKKLLMKLYGVVLRELELFFRTGHFDVSLSHGSGHAVHVAAARKRKSIHIYDNDLCTISSKWVLPFLDFLIMPQCIEIQKFQRRARKLRIYPFNGFKEDIYIADYKPDPNFLRVLPFEEFVAVRPEALKAEYVPKDARSIIPDLLKELDQAGFNVLFFPRYLEDRTLAGTSKNLYISPEPLNGLDVCYYSQAVLTGSGTFAREAAVMGTPAVSFFPGKELLSVDLDMIQKGWIIHSRMTSEIVDFVKNSKKKDFQRKRSKGAKDEVIEILNRILEEIET